MVGRFRQKMFLKNYIETNFYHIVKFTTKHPSFQSNIQLFKKYLAVCGHIEISPFHTILFCIII